VGTVGRLVDVKCHPLLIRAFAKAFPSERAAHLVIVGDGPRRTELERLTKSLGIADRVRFVGYQADPAPFLHAMDMFALASSSEGMPQALLEACVAGRPVIASNVGGIPDVIVHGRTGLLFRSGDEDQLAAGLITLLARPELAAGFAAAARERVEADYSIGRMASEYDRDFRALLGQRVSRQGWPVVGRIVGALRRT
jgi:glycosyltransferase involved in cell wall biosynthesis